MQWPRKLQLSFIVMLFPLILCRCSTFNSVQDSAPNVNVNVAAIKSPVPKPLAKSRYGNPASYVVNGKRYYVLRSSDNYNQTGIASWYGTKFHGRLTSSREPYNMYAMTAASPVLPIPCYVRVTNLENGRQIIVKVNDRGPFAPNRIIDLSYVAAIKLGYEKQGTTLVRVTAINVPNPNPLHATPKLYLQIGAFSDHRNAAKIKARASLVTTEPVHIFSNNNPGSPIYKVQIGPLSSIGQSDALLERLYHAGYKRTFSIVK